MWPLLGLSVLAVTLIFERCWFWFKTNHPRRLGRVATVRQLLRRGLPDDARALAVTDFSVYGRVAHPLLQEKTLTQALLTEVIQLQRTRLERFMPTLSTIITVAPMLGILGTVFGIISSFEVLSQQQIAMADPRDVGQGIAEALLTTAAGLIVAIVVLFPYNAFRAQVDRTLDRLESLADACASGPQVQETTHGQAETEVPGVPGVPGVSVSTRS